MRKLISESVHSETFRYLVFGVLTVAVNITAYHLLVCKLNTLTANTLAFFIAILFAYWTNSRFVFEVPCTKRNFTQFMGMRIGTLFIDDGGMLLLLRWGCNGLVAKCIINGFIIVLNYIFSKLFIFRKPKEKNGK